MRGYARGLLPQIDYDRLLQRLSRRRLLPTLGPRIIELVGDDLSDTFVEATEDAVRKTRLQSEVLLLVGDSVRSALLEAGIDSTPLKGPVLGEAIYGDPGRRMSNDIDLLLHKDQIQVAADVLRGIGYGGPVDHVDARGLPLLHFTLEHQAGALPPVELHWRVHWYECEFAQDLLLPPVAAPKDWWPTLAAQLAALLLFYARDGFVDLRLATDLGAWWDRFGDGLGRNALDDIVSSYPALARSISVAANAASRVVGLPVEDLFEDPRIVDLRGRMALRLANPNPRDSMGQLHADTGFIDGLLTPPRDLRMFLRRQVFIPRDVFVRDASLTPHWRAGSVYDYAARVLMRYAFTLVRTLGSPERVGGPE
jgi:hypothetical protein